MMNNDSRRVIESGVRLPALLKFPTGVELAMLAGLDWIGGLPGEAAPTNR